MHINRRYFLFILVCDDILFDNKRFVVYKICLLLYIYDFPYTCGLTPEFLLQHVTFQTHFDNNTLS